MGNLEFTTSPLIPRHLICKCWQSRFDFGIKSLRSEVKLGINIGLDRRMSPSQGSKIKGHSHIKKG